MQAFFYLLRAAAGLPGSSLVLDLSPLVRASKRCQAGTACFMPGARFLCLLPSLPALSASRTGPGATAFDRQPTRKHGGIPNPALVIGGARNDARLGLLLAERGAASGGQASGIISGLEEANWLREKGGDSCAGWRRVRAPVMRTMRTTEWYTMGWKEINPSPFFQQ